MRWTDSEEIGELLSEKHEEIDPLRVRFTDLHRMVCELQGFDDDPTNSNEAKLEAIQMAWYDEYRDSRE